MHIYALNKYMCVHCAVLFYFSVFNFHKSVFMFSVYDITDLSTPDTMVWMQDNVPGATKFFEHESIEVEPSLIGLSLGEVQQTIMDYVRNDVRHKCHNKVFATMYDIAEFSSDSKKKNFIHKPRTCDNAEEFIYSLSTCEIAGLWMFDKVSLYITEED